MHRLDEHGSAVRTGQLTENNGLIIWQSQYGFVLNSVVYSVYTVRVCAFPLVCYFFRVACA